MTRLPLALAVLLLSLLLPAALALGATEPAPVAATAQDEDVSGDDTNASDAGVDENDTNGDGTITCEDFTTQADAQTFFDTLAADDDLIVVLDSDGNGVACEELSTDPSGGVHTGDGGTAVLPGPLSDDGGTGSATGAVLVFVALLSAAGSIALLRRRPLGR